MWARQNCLGNFLAHLPLHRPKNAQVNGSLKENKAIKNSSDYLFTTSAEVDALCNLSCRRRWDACVPEGLGGIAGEGFLHWCSLSSFLNVVGAVHSRQATEEGEKNKDKRGTFPSVLA